MTLSSSASQANLARFIADAASASSAQVRGAKLLSGGAIQENWLVETSVMGGPLAGRQALVLRSDAATTLDASRTREEEFALLSAAHRAGVTVPEPLFLCLDPAVIGRPFYLMRRAGGTASGHVVVKEARWGGTNEALAERLGRELARIHAIRPPRADLAFLGDAPADPAAAAIADCRRGLDRLDDPRPIVEWGLRWLERHPPGSDGPVLCHRDFRTGNYMVDETGLTAILDWEFAAWGDRHEDLGWFCSKSWRFGQLGREAGGIADRAPLYRGYETESARPVDSERVRWWELMASVRWAIIAVQQGERVLKAGERSLDLALTGRRPAECELEILLMIDSWPRAAA